LSIVPGKTKAQHAAHAKAETAIAAFLEHWDVGGRAALLAFLEHPSPEVRVEAASYALESDPALALSVLEELEKSKPPVGLVAMSALFAWRDGTYIGPSRLRQTK
jgi:hypothetical protein